MFANMYNNYGAIYPPFLEKIRTYRVSFIFQAARSCSFIIKSCYTRPIAFKKTPIKLRYGGRQS